MNQCDLQWFANLVGTVASALLDALPVGVQQPVAGDRKNPQSRGLKRKIPDASGVPGLHGSTSRETVNGTQKCHRALTSSVAANCRRGRRVRSSSRITESHILHALQKRCFSSSMLKVSPEVIFFSPGECFSLIDLKESPSSPGGNSCEAATPVGASPAGSNYRRARRVAASKQES